MALSLISLTLGCAHKDAGKGLVKLTGRNSSNLDLSPESDTGTDFDSTFYIGYVDYFPETKEFYTAVFYREGHEYPDEDLLESKLDSVILLDEDWGRERLPFAEARKLLVLSGLDTLSIYNRTHELVCHCPLTRVEYLWNGLENYFIAVFKSDADFAGQTEELYGISKSFDPQNFSRFSASEISDSELNQQVIKKLHLSRNADWQMRHYRISASGNIFSVISSYDLQSNEGHSYLAVSVGDSIQILNDESNNFHFLNILPVPVRMNGKPLLLITAGYPSSDVLWDYLAGFDGSGYHAIDYNRVHLREVSDEWVPALSQANANAKR